jgi:hypothetical protein
MSKQYTIINKSNELNFFEKYALIESPAIISLKNLENGDLICVGSWVEYKTVDNSGNEIICVSIQDANTGEVYSGQSATFRETFFDIIDKMSDYKDEIDTIFIEVLHRTSKSGRDYLICAIVSPDRALARMGYPEKNIPMPEPQK